MITTSGRAGDSELISVLMPTYGHAAFVRRAIDSLMAQSVASWELIVIDDASPDETGKIVAGYAGDPRVRYQRLPENAGLGAALNHGLHRARGRLIAYLPSDDVFYRDHLSQLETCLRSSPNAVLAYSGVRHHYNHVASGQIDGSPLQLVQVMHRRTDDRWMERTELATDDLERMMWAKLGHRGPFVCTGEVTCEWVDHPLQRHKVMQEPVGGINPYRSRYGVGHPLRYHSSAGNFQDEVELYRPFRERPDTAMANDGLRILLAGELAYNPERVLALEERGHKIYGLWTPDPHGFNTVGPLPFGHVQEIPPERWADAVRAEGIDIIYALLNWQAVPFAHRILRENPGVPFVWHFKEGPFICLQRGTWPQLLDLYSRSDGQIYTSAEMRDWFHTVMPGLDGGTSLILDGDLPKDEWFTDARSPLLSSQDGEIHTVVPGRPIGLHAHTVGELADAGIHLHFYGDFVQGQWSDWIERALPLAPGHLHMHPNVDQRGWVAEFSQYDAGWLHFLQSSNGGEIRRAIWDDLNLPARMATYAAAGLPMITADNTGSVVATQSLAASLDIGVFATDIADLAQKLRDSRRMAEIRGNVWRHRGQFTFDYHADRLIAFFRSVIATHR